MSADLPGPASCRVPVPVHPHLAQLLARLLGLCWASAEPAAKRDVSTLCVGKKKKKERKNTTAKEDGKNISFCGETINGFSISCRGSCFSTTIKQWFPLLCLKKDGAHRVHLERQLFETMGQRLIFVFSED